MRIGSVAQLNRASDYGSEGCGFESRRNHLIKPRSHFDFLAFCCIIVRNKKLR